MRVHCFDHLLLWLYFLFSQEPLFVCVQRGELSYLIELLKKDPTGVNACDEVRGDGGRRGGEDQRTKDLYNLA